MSKQAIKDEITLATANHVAAINKICEMIRNEFVIPYCEETGRSFHAGMGTWTMGDVEPTGDLMDLLQAGMIGTNYYQIGTWVKDYTPKSATSGRKYIVTVGLEGGYLPDQVEKFDTLAAAHDWAQGEAEVYESELDFTIRGLGWTEEDTKWLWVCTPLGAASHTLDTIIMIEEAEEC